VLCTRKSPELFAAVCAEVFVGDEFLLFPVIKKMRRGRSSGGGTGERRGALSGWKRWRIASELRARA
jgi:hypothetical protein